MMVKPAAVQLSVILCMLLFRRCTGAAMVLAKSDLDMCTNTGDPGALNCKKKIILTLSVPAKKGRIGESSVSEVKDHTSKEGKQILTNKIDISISKSAPVVTYSIEYVQNVNADPQERYVSKKNNCRARLDDSATCGVLKTENGQYVPGSSGFCCTCERFKKYKYFRGLSTPGGCGSPFKAPGYAFCLRYGKMWYGLYRIRTGTMEFQINIRVTDTSSNAEEFVYISPSMKQGINKERSMIAFLVGDLASYTQHPMLEGKVFCKPIGGDFREFSSMKEARIDSKIFLVMDEARFGFSGMICDKIGVSCEGFTYQPKTCVGKMGMCLHEQIVDFLREDKAATDRKRLPIHSVLRWGKVRTLIQDQEQFSIQVSPTVSIITIELSADSIQFVKNRGKGKIVEATIPKFESLSTEGSMKVVVLNVGTIEATFGLYIECSQNIDPIEGKVLPLSPNVPETFMYVLYTRNKEASTNQCKVTLKDVEGETLDTKDLSVTTTATVLTNGTQMSGVDVAVPRNESFSRGLFGKGGLFGKLGGGIKNIAKGAFNIVTKPFKSVFGLFDNILGKCEQCSKPLDIGCYVKHFCVKKIVLFVGVIIAAAVGLYIVILLQGMGLLSPLCGCAVLPLKVLLSARPSLGSLASLGGGGGGGDGGESPSPKKAAQQMADEEEIDYEGMSSLFEEEEHEQIEEDDEDEGDDDEDEDDEEE